MAGNSTLTFKTPGSVQPVASAIGPALRSFDLFPTRIWQASLPALAPQLQQWIAAVLALRVAHPQPAGRTNRQGWNSEDMSILEQPVFAPLRRAIHSGCAAALGEMGVRGIPFALQSWINLHDRGGFNFLHVHEGCLLSGCFYLSVPAGSGKLVFRDPRPGVIHGYVKGAVPNGYSDIRLAPETGLLVLFPCWMEHFVEPHESDEPRISISFNAVTA
jgi:uncharacterized protein (TIGR02466 family)